MQGSSMRQTAQMLADLFISHEQRIVDAVSTGAQWEIWLQVEFLLWVRETQMKQNVDWSAARELSYQNSKQKVDFGLRRGSKYYGIELKAESAGKWPGKVTSSELWKGMQEDVQKLSDFYLNASKSNTDYEGGLAIGIVFHPKLKDLGLNELNGDNSAKVSLKAEEVLYSGGTNIGVIIAITD